MANIERRRKHRKLTLILTAVGIAAVILGAAALVFFLTRRGKTAGSPNDQKASASAPATASTPAPTEFSEASAEPSEFTTDEPLDEPIPTAVPVSTDEALQSSEPVRISDDLSSCMLVMTCTKRYDAQGNAKAHVDASLSISFVNNTSSVMYFASFNVSSLSIKTVTVDSVHANFSVSDGVLFIPFVNELRPSEEVLIYVEFTDSVENGGSISLPEPDYDTPYILSAYITSDAFITFKGCKAKTAEDQGRLDYSIEDASVRSVSISLRY